MSGALINCGFIPLVDCAPLVVAKEMGFAEEEGVDLVLHKEPSWSAIRDKLALGRLEAAHMLSPMPIAMSMGIAGVPQRIDVLMVLSICGDVVGISPDLAAQIKSAGPLPPFDAAKERGRRLIAVTDGRLRIGVPFPFSMHAELLYYWLGALGMRVPQDLDVRTVPPPLMADAMAAGEIDAFCVGEPWGSIAVEKGVADLFLPGCAIWRGSPEKVLAVRNEWVEEKGELAARLMRSVWRAARWLNEPKNRLVTAELLAQPSYVDVSTEIIERALAGSLVTTAEGESAQAPQFLKFFDGAAQFPWRSQAVWIATQLAVRLGLDRSEAAVAARACFRSDLYRQNIGALGIDLPLASEKLEGTMSEPIAARSTAGEIMLGPDSFFDGQVFDPVGV